VTAIQERTQASLEELQAAAAAARRGDFALHRPTSAGSPAPGTPRLAAPTAPAVRDTSGWRPSGPVVAVMAGHSGAGASTVSVTLAEALADAGTRVRIVEIADASRSGLAGATTAELGEDGTGWRRGRRGDIHIDRLAFRAAAIEQVPAPAAAPHPDEVLVLDIGWPARDALAAAGWLATAIAESALLLVCRPTVPGIRQTEYLLAELAEQTPATSVAVASIGPARWPGAATASAGPQIRAAREAGRVITVPIDRRVETDGVSAEALPKALAAAGKALAAALPSPALHDHPTDQSALGRAG
jgi:hypothetical protein